MGNTTLQELELMQGCFVEGHCTKNVHLWNTLPTQWDPAKLLAQGCFVAANWSYQMGMCSQMQTQQNRPERSKILCFTESISNTSVFIFFVLFFFSLVPLLSLHLSSLPFLNISLSLLFECKAMHIYPSTSTSPSVKLGTLCKSLISLHPNYGPHRAHTEWGQRSWVLRCCTWPNVWSLLLHQKPSHTLSLEKNDLRPSHHLHVIAC